MRDITLPLRTGQPGVEIIAIIDSLVIIGANGTGKSRLGSFIEHKVAAQAVKRISAQRLLDLPEHTPVMSFTQAIQQFINSSRNQSVIAVQNDYQNVLAAIFARTAKRDSDYVKLCKESESNVRPPIPESSIEKLIKIWNDVLPHRQIFLEDSRVRVVAADGQQYTGREMSDGERVALYLIAQCLVVPDGYTVIIDEPELHLHKALMSRLWNKIETERSDCLFVYITHDLDFAASRVKASKIWVQSYLNNRWVWDFVPDSDEIPENLLLEIIGSRKPILFVEGEKGSYDFAIYQSFYPEMTIMPRGSGLKVIESVKGIESNEILHSISGRGLIDRDYRSQSEIEALRKHKVFTIDVAEVENILLTPDIIKIVAEHLALDPSKKIQEVTDFVISSLEADLDKEVSFKTSLEISYRLKFLDSKQVGVNELKDAVKNLAGSIDVERIFNETMEVHKDIIKTKDLKKALRYHTNKGLLPNASKFFGLQGHEYPKLILRLLKTAKKTAIHEALKEYLPVFD